MSFIVTFYLNLAVFPELRELYKIVNMLKNSWCGPFCETLINTYQKYLLINPVYISCGIPIASWMHRGKDEVRWCQLSFHSNPTMHWESAKNRNIVCVYILSWRQLLGLFIYCS